MVKKRKFEATNAGNHKSTAIEVITENLDSNPLCLHGPTLLFSTDKGRYYGCSSCRNKKDCTIHIEEEEWHKEGVKKRNEKYYSLIPKIDKVAAWNHLSEVSFYYYIFTGFKLGLLTTYTKLIFEFKALVNYSA